MQSWKGTEIKNPTGKVGIVTEDVNCGIHRKLIVQFDDESVEELFLNNVGPNSEETQRWKWDFYGEWAEWET